MRNIMGRTLLLTATGSRPAVGRVAAPGTPTLLSRGTPLLDEDFAVGMITFMI
jgi:hypothetical protein